MKTSMPCLTLTSREADSISRLCILLYIRTTFMYCFSSSEVARKSITNSKIPKGDALLISVAQYQQYSNHWKEHWKSKETSLPLKTSLNGRNRIRVRKQRNRRLWAIWIYPIFKLRGGLYHCTMLKRLNKVPRTARGRISAPSARGPSR